MAASYDKIPDSCPCCGALPVDWTDDPRLVLASMMAPVIYHTDILNKNIDVAKILEEYRKALSEIEE